MEGFSLQPDYFFAWLPSHPPYCHRTTVLKCKYSWPLNDAWVRGAHLHTAEILHITHSWPSVYLVLHPRNQPTADHIQYYCSISWKASTYKWTGAVQARVVQRSAVQSFITLSMRPGGLSLTLELLGSVPFHFLTPIFRLLSHWHPSLQQLQTTQPVLSSLLVHLPGKPSLILFHMAAPPLLFETWFSITSAL